MIKNFGVIGDVHAEDRLLATALSHLRTLTSVLFCVGDIADGYGDVDRCCTLLRENEVMTVRGNHDRWLAEGSMRVLKDASSLGSLSLTNRNWLRALGAMSEHETVAGRLLLCHGIGSNDMAYVNPDDFGYAIESNDDLQGIIRNRRFSVMVNGHSHKKMVRKLGTLNIINAGTLKKYSNPCCVFVDLEERQVQFYNLFEDGRVEAADKHALSRGSS